MDEDLKRLERAAQAEPTCEATVRRYEQALQRTGRHDDLRARYRFKFVCPLRFEDLGPTADPRVKTCDRCRKPVYLVASPAELSERVARRECVAFERRALEEGLAGLVARPDLHSAGEAQAPCVVSSAVGTVDLSAVTPTPDALAAVPTELARGVRVVPLAWEDGTLVLASARTTDASVLRGLLAAPLRLLLADPSALDRALDAHYPEPTHFLMGEVAGDAPMVMGGLEALSPSGSSEEDLGEGLHDEDLEES